MNIRPYRPHEGEHHGAIAALDAARAGKIRLTAEDTDPCLEVIEAYLDGDTVTEDTISRCHDAILALRATL